MTFDGYVGVGSVVAPLETQTGNSLLRDADPTVYNLLSYTSEAIEHFAGQRWVEAVSSVNLASLVPVALKVGGLDPLKYLQQAQFRFPLLSIYRTEKATINRVLGSYAKNSEISIIYSLPPLDVRQAISLLPFLNLFADVLEDRLLRDFSVLFKDSVEEITVLNTQFGDFPDMKSEGYYPTFLMTLRVQERQTFPAQNSDPLRSVTTDITSGPEEEAANINENEILETFL